MARKYDVGEDVLKFGLQDQLPHDRETEKNVLGTIINEDGAFSAVSDVLNSEAFHDGKLKAIFRCVKYLIQGGKVVDTRAVLDTAARFSEKLDVDVEDYDVLEVYACSSPNTFEQDVERLLDYSQRRRAWNILIRASHSVVTLADDSTKTIDETITKLNAVKDSLVIEDGVINAETALRAVYKQINDNIAGINQSCVKSGFRFSDDKGGFRLGQLIVIGAWTGVGKTVLSMNISVNMAARGVPVAYYSLEMSATDLWARVLCEKTGIPAWKIQGYALTKVEMEMIDNASRDLQYLPLYIDDKSTTAFDKMIRSIRKMKKKYGIKVFFVDYLQIFAQSAKGGNEESSLAYMIRELKNICMELEIVGFAVSQLRRAGDEKHPQFNMLRGSGQIEESADVVVLIDRPEAHPDWGVTQFQNNRAIDIQGHAELRVVKGRNIGTGTYYTGFDNSRYVFYEEDGSYDEYEEVTEDEEEKESMPF